MRKAALYLMSVFLMAGAAFINSDEARASIPQDFLTDDSGRPLNYNPVPLSRPDPTSIYNDNIVKIALPAPRPSAEDAFGTSTASLREMVARETKTLAASEETYLLRSGETLASILKRGGFNRTEAANLIQQMQSRINVRRLQIGMAFTIAYDSANKPIAVHYKDKSEFDHYILYSEELAWFAFRTVRPIQRYVVYANGVIDGTIYDSVEEQNVPFSALDEFVRVLGFSVDFQREIRKGDEFELLYEREIDQLTGEDLNSGTLHYAGLRLSGDTMSFFRFENSDGVVGWYDRDGESAVRTLMRTPINGARMSSKYGMRRHPITGYNAMHKGVDFGAPKGTPILAAGSGVVQKSGWFGNYGRYVRIRHTSRYSTAYAHMTRIASGVTPGARVRQGQIIGYVGSTGRSTGPHLHYEVLVNNRQVNPLTVKLPSGESLDASEMADFTKVISSIESEVASRGQILFANAN